MLLHSSNKPMKVSFEQEQFLDNLQSFDLVTTSLLQSTDNSIKVFATSSTPFAPEMLMQYVIEGQADTTLLTGTVCTFNPKGDNPTMQVRARTNYLTALTLLSPESKVYYVSRMDTDLTDTYYVKEITLGALYQMWEIGVYLYDHFIVKQEDIKPAKQKHYKVLYVDMTNTMNETQLTVARYLYHYIVHPIALLLKSNIYIEAEGDSLYLKYNDFLFYKVDVRTNAIGEVLLSLDDSYNPLTKLNEEQLTYEVMKNVYSKLSRLINEQTSR